MKHSFDLVGANGVTKRVDVSDVGVNEWPPAHEALMPGGKIIKHHRRIARSVERLAGMRSHVTRATGHQNRTRAHHKLASISVIEGTAPLCLLRLGQPAVQNTEWSWSDLL